MDLDYLKTIRETIDWLIEKYKDIQDVTTKKKLNKVADQIIELSAHKAAYLAQLKTDLRNNSGSVDLAKLQSTLRVAEKDTNKLRELLESLSFDASKISFSLKEGMKSLTMKKQVKVEELKQIIAKEVVTNEDHQFIVHELDLFESKWKELGQEIDDYFKLTRKPI